MSIEKPHCSQIYSFVFLCHVPTLRHHDRVPPGGNMLCNHEDHIDVNLMKMRMVLITMTLSSLDDEFGEDLGLSLDDVRGLVNFTLRHIRQI